MVLLFCVELITEHSFLTTVTTLKNLDLQSNLVKKAINNKQHNLGTRGPFLESPGNLTGPKSCFEIKISRNVGCVLASNEVHFDSLTDNFTVPFLKLLKLRSLWKTKQLNGPGASRNGPQEQILFLSKTRFSSIQSANRLLHDRLKSARNVTLFKSAQLCFVAVFCFALYKTKVCQ